MAEAKRALTERFTYNPGAGPQHQHADTKTEAAVNEAEAV